MRKTFIYGLLAGLGLMYMTVCPLKAQDAVPHIQVVHTNDTHSCVMPVNPNFSDTAQADKGGFVRRVALVKELRRKDPEMLLFDSGDFSQGSAYYNLYKGEVEVKLMNEMRYDAATLGNHEFDFGLENLKRILQMADFPFVCANYGFEGTVLEGMVKPYVVLNRKGLKVGVFGLGPKMEGLVSAENCKGVTYEDPIQAANRVAAHLKQTEHCDLVVCLSHLGWNIAGTDDAELIPATRNIDLVLGGHSHSYFEHPKMVKNAEGKEVVCNQMGKNGRYVGTLRLSFSAVSE